MKDKIIIVLLVCIIFLFIVVGFGISKLTNNNNNYFTYLGRNKYRRINRRKWCNKQSNKSKRRIRDK